MLGSIITAPQVKLERLENLYIELTNKNCNLKCKHCYINFDPYKKIKDFIGIDLIKSALNDTQELNIKMIYLTGGEPLLHPDFNNILRTCLKYKPVTIFSNGVNINDKKARFLRKVEEEGKNELFFYISIDHFEERKNDDLRGRGSFRSAFSAIQSLSKHTFTPTIKYTNYHQELEKDIKEGISIALKRFNLTEDDIILEILPWFDKNKKSNPEKIKENVKFPCQNTRILSSMGIFNCPFLVNDFRGRAGSDFKNFSKTCYLESEFCEQCIQWRNSLIK